ncbi:MAG: hypothetical protein EXR90_00600 [Methyloglobulus sp.]|nr:hypothetical protein [Methyloglobulus sp.]
MKKLIYFFLLFSRLAIADPSLTDQLNALDNAQTQSIAAQQTEQKRLEDITIKQRNADRRLQEKSMQMRAEANKAAIERARVAASKVEAERLQDKARSQTQEDEERAYIKQQSALKIEQEALETQRLKAKADLEAAIANDRIKTVSEETALARKKEATEIDVVQSGADVNRTVAGGVNSYLSGTGNEGLYKFLVVISLVILVLLVVVIGWLFYNRKKSNEKANSIKVNNASPLDSDNQENL